VPVLSKHIAVTLPAMRVLSGFVPKMFLNLNLSKEKVIHQPKNMGSAGGIIQVKVSINLKIISP
jgi:hypothetical protein